MSAAEHHAWQALRLLRDEGVHVVRQHQIGRFTVDFAIRKLRIAIEIDGGVHDLPGRRDADAVRQRQLENIGWTFVRIPARLATDGDHVRNAVRAALPPSPRGEGAGGGVRLGAENPDDDVEICAANSERRASPRPLTPSPQGEGERRTRANRVLPPRRK